MPTLNRYPFDQRGTSMARGAAMRGRVHRTSARPQEDSVSCSQDLGFGGITMHAIQGVVLRRAISRLMTNVHVSFAIQDRNNEIKLHVRRLKNGHRQGFTMMYNTKPTIGLREGRGTV